MKRKIFFLLSACLLFTQMAFSQNEFPCATYFLHQQALQDPAYFQQHQALEQEALEYFSLSPAAEKKGEAATIPVVVHIIHNNGPENLSDAQVQQAIAWLNQAFANQGYYDQGSGAEVGIQFCLAKRTPDGETTNGITRDQSPLTELDIETEQLSMKNLNRWKPKEYINIWLVNTICSNVTGCGVSAYAYFPSSHGNNLDGIVAEYGHFTSPAQVTILAHEMGHYFGLRHTFEGGCSNGNCLTDGDKVCDTPPDQSTSGIPCGQTANTCSTDTQSGFATDQPDMTTNFVDYGNLDCLQDFTAGQAGRMNFFLNGARKSLLASKGCLPPCPLQPTAAFSSGDTTILAGQTLFFDNTSQNAVYFSWTLNGIPFGGQQNATYFFDTAGVFTIKLVAQPLDALLCDADSMQVTVQVLCPVEADFTLSNLTPEAGQTVFITNNSQNANAFEWFVNGVSQGATLDSIVSTQSGSYEIRLVAKGDFCNSSAVQEVFVRDSCTSKTFFLSHPVTSGEEIEEAQSSAVLTDGGFLMAGRNISNDSIPSKVFFVKMKSDGSVLWSKYVGQYSAHNASCFSIVATPDGGFAALIFQDFNSVLFPNLLDEGYYLIKFSADGTMEWARTLSEIPVTLPSPIIYKYFSLILTTDGGLLVDQKTKFDLNGNLLWSKDFGPYDYAAEYRAAPCPDGGHVSVKLDPYGFAISSKHSVTRFDADGNALWSKELNQDFLLIDVKVSPSEDIFIVGKLLANVPTFSHTLLLKLSPEGEILWSRRYLRKQTSIFEPLAFTIANDGITIFARVWFSASPLVTKSYRALLHTDFDGNIVWLRHFEDKFYASLSSNPLFGYPASVTSISAISGGGYWGVCKKFVPPVEEEIGYFKADPLGYAGECESVTEDLHFEDEPISESPFAIAPQPGPVDFPFTNLTIEDFPFTLDTLCAPACPRGIEICNNNLDDDSDGLFDCLDPDCDCAEDVCAPKEANIWYFGNHAGLDFNTEPPTVLADGKTMNDAGSAVTCDAKGNLLFYSDGKTVYNRFHEPMPNGSGLGTLQHEAVAIPHPGETGLYYLFTVTINGAWYSLIDMKLDGGKGDVVADKKSIPFSTFILFEPRMAVTKSCTFNGYWLVLRVAGAGTGTFWAFRIDENGLAPNPVFSNGGTYIVIEFNQMKISPNGAHLAKIVGGANMIELYDFNSVSGEISGQKNLSVFQFGEPYGLEFSPNGRYLYCSIRDAASLNTKLLQLDLEAGNVNQIIASIQVIASKPMISPFKYCYGALQLAPNGKIIVTDRNLLDLSSSILHIIHQPDLSAPYCQFQEGGITLVNTSAASSGLVNFPQNLFAESGSVKFSKEFSPDTICVFDSLYTYVIEKTGCFSYDSILWKMEGLSGTLNADYSYGWVKFDAPSAGLIIATAYTECGVVADTLPIIVAEPFDKTLDLGPDQVVCDNGVVTLNAGSGFARYRWQNGSPDSLLTTLLPGIYWVDVWDACGNQQTDTVIVSVAPATVLDLGEDQDGCPDLTKTFQRPDFFSHWQWSPDDFLSCDTCAAVTVSPVATTSWTVVAHTDDGCISVDTLTFQIQDTLFFQLDTSVCRGQTIDLFGASLPADTTAQFFFANSGLGCDTLLTVNVLGLDAPFLEIEETVCANAFFTFNGVALPADTTAVFLFPGTGSECDSVFTVTVNSYPPLTVTLPPDTTLRIGATLILNAETTGTGTLTFIWVPADGLSCSDCSDPEASPLETTLYALQVADANGCSAQDSMLVVVDTVCNVIIPNAFSPNGDGVNDWFYPRADPCVRTVRVWRVVSRWGEIVFEKSNFLPNDPSLGWDGSRPNGEPFPSDVLVWYAELEYYDGKKEVKKGDVALLR